MTTLIKGGKIVNENRIVDGTIVIEDGIIADITDNNRHTGNNIIDATGCYVLPGIIDCHVHFREPGLTQKADIESESKAAAIGGVTSYFDMPNTMPQTTTIEAWNEKRAIAARQSHVNYACFFGATNDNTTLFSQLDRTHVPGIKLFMGSSTGNMLVDRREALEKIFSETTLPIMAHCEDTAIIQQNMAAAKAKYGDDPDVTHHADIRSAEACFASTQLAVQLAAKHHARLHVAHLTTARELSLFGQHSNITAEAVVGHLWFTRADHATQGTKIKVNPAIKSATDRQALRQALNDGRITTVGTDHAPHRLSEKNGGCCQAASGMPMIQYSLPTMLELVEQRVLPIQRMVALMCHQPATLFDVCQRGFIRKGYHADLVIVRPDSPWTVTPQSIASKCGWSPMEGQRFHWRVEQTICNGHLIYHNGVVDTSCRGEEITFLHPSD